MASLSKHEIVAALRRLGELAADRGIRLDLVVVGGAFMALAFDARESTKDVDAICLDPDQGTHLRDLAAAVSREFGWPVDWLNDGAKGYLVGRSTGPVLVETDGLRAIGPTLEQLLAMKLCAWRDDVDIADAALLLREVAKSRSRDEIWQAIREFLVPGHELEAEYALSDLWGDVNDPD